MRSQRTQSPCSIRRLTSAGCAAPTPEVIKETVVVEKEVTKVVTEEKEVTKVVEKEVTKVVEKVVTATPVPKEAVSIVATSQMGIATWDNSLERAKERFDNINMTVILE